MDKDGADNSAFIRGIAEVQEKKSDKFISLGLAASAVEPRFNNKSPYSTVVPLINAKYNNFYTFGGIYNGYNFYEGAKLTLNFTAEYRFAGHTEEDFDSYLKELPDEDNPIMLGIGGSYQVGYLLLTGGIRHNVRGNSDENTASDDSKIPSHNIDGFGSAIRFTAVIAYSFNRNIDLFTHYYIESLSDNIKKSPLIKGSNSSMIGLGATYTF